MKENKIFLFSMEEQKRAVEYDQKELFELLKNHVSGLTNEGMNYIWKTLIKGKTYIKENLLDDYFLECSKEKMTIEQFKKECLKINCWRAQFGIVVELDNSFIFLNKLSNEIAKSKAIYILDLPATTDNLISLDESVYMDELNLTSKQKEENSFAIDLDGYGVFLKNKITEEGKSVSYIFDENLTIRENLLKFNKQFKNAEK